MAISNPDLPPVPQDKISPLEKIRKEIEMNLDMYVPEPEKELEYMISKVMKEMHEFHFGKIDEIIKEGLRLKGYEFETDAEAINFIKRHCVCADHGRSKTYYVKGVPFLRWEEPNLPTIKQGSSEYEITLEATMGSYYFV